MTKQELIQQIRLKESFLCVGLDPDMSKIPTHLLEMDDPIFEFNKAIIDATHPYAVAFKPNTAFFECH
ncbi:MAG: orotidine 5'-phosphate decarboxylase, partial [Crocinitomicaceae bacterium]|nr:orotidine 5'-phosphate decarboxylase [Crocinitomicaceae bacterium]